MTIIRINIDVDSEFGDLDEYTVKAIRSAAEELALNLAFANGHSSITITPALPELQEAEETSESFLGERTISFPEKPKSSRWGWWR